MYYIGSLSFGEVDAYISPINDELHKSELLSQMIQRSITENYKSIAKLFSNAKKKDFFKRINTLLYIMDSRYGMKCG